MSDIFNRGPSKAKQYVDFFTRADEIPTEELTKGRLVRLAAELGSTDPAARADEYLKSFREHRNILKEEREGIQTRKTLEALPQFAPSDVTPQDLTTLVQAAKPDLPIEPFFQAAQSQDLGKFISPLEAIGFENLPASIRNPIALEALSTALLPSTSEDFKNLSEIELLVLANSGDPQQRELATKVLEDLQERKVEISAQQGVERERLKRNLPLTGEERSTLVHPETLASPPVGMSSAEATKQGFVGIRPQDKQKLADFAASEVLIESIFGLADQLITADNALDAVKQGAVLLEGAVTKRNPTAAAYRDLRASFAGTLSRSLAAERGVLTDRDITRIVNAFPALNDTVQVKEYKKGLINLLYQRTFDEVKALATGRPRDAREWRKELEEMILQLSGKPIGVTKDGKTVIELPNGTRKVVD